MTVSTTSVGAGQGAVDLREDARSLCYVFTPSSLNEYVASSSHERDVTPADQSLVFGPRSFVNEGVIDDRQELLLRDTGARGSDWRPDPVQLPLGLAMPDVPLFSGRISTSVVSGVPPAIVSQIAESGTSSIMVVGRRVSGCNGDPENARDTTRKWNATWAGVASRQ